MASRSSRLYLERLGLYRVHREPLPAVRPGANPVLNAAVSDPLPRAEYLINEHGVPAPDRGTSTPFPHAVDGS